MVEKSSSILYIINFIYIIFNIKEASKKVSPDCLPEEDPGAAQKPQGHCPRYRVAGSIPSILFLHKTTYDVLVLLHKKVKIQGQQ